MMLTGPTDSLALGDEIGLFGACSPDELEFAFGECSPLWGGELLIRHERRTATSLPLREPDGRIRISTGG